MTIKQFQTYQEQTFDSFCKTVIRNESIDARRELAALSQHEIQLSALSPSESASLYVMDTYHPYCRTYYVCGKTVNVYDQSLGEALQFIPPWRRDIILLYYFLGYTDTEIAVLLGLSNSTVNYRRMSALRSLKDLLEGMKDGK